MFLLAKIKKLSFFPFFQNKWCWATFFPFHCRNYKRIILKNNAQITEFRSQATKWKRDLRTLLMFLLVMPNAVKIKDKKDNLQDFAQFTRNRKDQIIINTRSYLLVLWRQHPRRNQMPIRANLHLCPSRTV